jgi:hypothetical protein
MFEQDPRNMIKTPLNSTHDLIDNNALLLHGLDSFPVGALDDLIAAPNSPSPR